MKRKSGRRSQKATDAENGVDQQNGDAEDEVENEPRKESPKKKQRKSGGAKGKKSKSGKEDKEQVESEAETSKEESDPLAQDEDMEYEVESILEEKRIKGVRHYLIRWKGYTEESDTWEPEDTLECADLIKEFRAKNKKKDPKRKKGEEKTWDENQDFEVERILDVYFHKNGKRDFLVSWKGYPASQNSWEPEDNMDCKDLIAKYMAKVETAKQYDGKELRVNRKRVNRLDLAMHVNARRLSKRRTGKERVHYFDE